MMFWEMSNIMKKLLVIAENLKRLNCLCCKGFVILHSMSENEV